MQSIECCIGMSTRELLIDFPIQLFVILTPVAAIAVLVSMTQNSPMSERVKISVQASVIAASILLVSGLFGPVIFSLFKITTESFRLAGGIYLMLIGIDLLSSNVSLDAAKNLRSPSANANMAISPIAMPLIAGPGTISYIFVIRSKVVTNFELLQFFIGIAVAMAAVAACFIAAVRASNAIPKSVMNFCQKITGIMIMCISVQILAKGINSIC